MNLSDTERARNSALNRVVKFGMCEALVPLRNSDIIQISSPRRRSFALDTLFVNLIELMPSASPSITNTVSYTDVEYASYASRNTVSEPMLTSNADDHR